MFQENEVISCVLTVGVVFFVLVNYHAAARIPRSGLMLSALLFFLLSNIFTICKGVWHQAFLDAFEHISYVISLVFLAIWCRWIYRHGERHA